MSISLISQGKFGGSGKLFSRKSFKKDVRKSFSLKGSKSFMKKHAGSLQNLTGICNFEKTKDKKEFYSDVNLHQYAPEDPEHSQDVEFTSNELFVEGINELEQEEVVEETFDHGQVSTQEQIIKGENFEYLEDYFTLEETEERVQENADVNTEADHEEEKHFDKNPNNSEQDGKDDSGLQQTEDSEEYNEGTNKAGYG